MARCARHRRERAWVHVPPSRTSSSSPCCGARCCARCKRHLPEGWRVMTIIGQPIDRVDGRLKVTGRAKYAAEFAVPGVVHAVLVQSTIGAGLITGFDLSEAQSMPGVIAIITPQNAPKLAMKGGAQQTVHAPLLQDMAIYYNGQH